MVQRSEQASFMFVSVGNMLKRVVLVFFMRFCGLVEVVSKVFSFRPLIFSNIPSIFLGARLESS